MQQFAKTTLAAVLSAALMAGCANMENKTYEGPGGMKVNTKQLAGCAAGAAICSLVTSPLSAKWVLCTVAACAVSYFAMQEKDIQSAKTFKDEVEATPIPVAEPPPAKQTSKKKTTVAAAPMAIKVESISGEVNNPDQNAPAKEKVIRAWKQTQFEIPPRALAAKPMPNELASVIKKAGKYSAEKHEPTIIIVKANANESQEMLRLLQSGIAEANRPNNELPPPNIKVVDLKTNEKPSINIQSARPDSAYASKKSITI